VGRSSGVVDIPGEELKKGFAHVVNGLAAVPGLRWKIWIMNEQPHEAGGLYLFDDQDAVEAYLEGPLVAALKTNPALSEFSFKQLDVLEDLTTITRGPVKQVRSRGKGDETVLTGAFVYYMVERDSGVGPGYVNLHKPPKCWQLVAGLC